MYYSLLRFIFFIGIILVLSACNTEYCVWQNKSAELCKVNMQSPALI